MRRLLPLLLIACSTDPATDGTETDVDSDGTDTDTVETDTVDTETDEPVDSDTGEPADTDTGFAPAEAWHHVIQSIEILPSGQGFDLNGDTQIDNQMGGLAAVFNPLMTDSYGINSPLLAMSQAWGVNDGDDQIDLGLLAGRDTDGNPYDNFTGTEVLRVIAGVGPSGHADLYDTTTVNADTTYDATLPAGTITLGQFALATATPIRVSGTITATAHNGRLGTAMSVTELQTLVTTLGMGWAGALIAPLADLDLDGDGTNDAVSVAMRFAAVDCLVEIAPP